MPNFDGTGGGSRGGNGGGFQGEGESQGSQDAVSRASPSSGLGSSADVPDGGGREQAIARSGQSRTGTQGRPQSDNSPPLPAATPLDSYDMFGNRHTSRAEAEAADSMFLGQSTDANRSDAYMAGLTGIPWNETEFGKHGQKIGLAGTIASAVMGIPALGIIARGLANRYTPEAKAFNLGRMKAGLSHHNPETGVWTSDTFDLFNPSAWHPGPPRSLNVDELYGDQQPSQNVGIGAPPPEPEVEPIPEPTPEPEIEAEEETAVERIRQEFEKKLKLEEQKMADLDAIIEEERKKMAEMDKMFEESWLHMEQLSEIMEETALRNVLKGDRNEMHQELTAVLERNAQA